MTAAAETTKTPVSREAAQERRMPDLIFVSLEDWDDIWRRNQFICAELARRFPRMRILFVGTPWNLTYHVRHGSLGRLRRPLTRELADFPNITVTNPPKLVPETLRTGRTFNDWLARRHIAGLARRMNLDRPLLWLNPPASGHMAGSMNECGVVYDITDDWCLAPSFSRRERELVTRQDRALCRRADLVIVCSQTLAEARSSMSRELLLLPNGVEVEHYVQVAAAPAKPRGSTPVFGYTGTLHADRTDVDLILDLARSFPDGRIMLVGPNFLSNRDRGRLAEVPNITVTGAVPYARVPEMMREFDICIVPHRETPFTDSLNPLKLWEYLACGKPIVSTNVAGFRDYTHLCSVASGSEAFVGACRAALHDKGTRRSDRIAEACRHTWGQRVDALLDALEEKQWLV